MTLTTDREEFEQWAELACELPWGFLAKRRKDSGEYADSTYEDMWKAWVAGREALANREAQPVAYTEQCEISNMQATGLYLRGFPDNSQGRNIPLYTSPPAPQSTSAEDWGINMQTGTPILVYKNCSVIESEQAHYVLSLINSAATPAPAVPPEASPDDIPQEHNINTYSGITWAASWNACRAAMLAAAPEGGNG
ncbi:hypothetical protein [Serratia marcescens]|uniref:hypothetical protein n=1 Tax=Serratia marcescens TaxID=615 RepID=UPI0013226468|nr:hypothetical protein [Serratia marcescens]MXS94426.1 hypothetical protein [Serratia marcescens]QHJ25333.1 hypothetical protein GV243_05800 [Serratia marcescens]